MNCTRYTLPYRTQPWCIDLSCQPSILSSSKLSVTARVSMVFIWSLQKSSCDNSRDCQQKPFDCELHFGNFLHVNSSGICKGFQWGEGGGGCSVLTRGVRFPRCSEKAFRFHYVCFLENSGTGDRPAGRAQGAGLGHFDGSGWWVSSSIMFPYRSTSRVAAGQDHQIVSSGVIDVRVSIAAQPLVQSPV